MKKLTFILVLAVILSGGALGAMSAPAYAQAYQYPPPPPNPYASPWVGSNTPWVYYSGDWFLNGLLYYFFGPQYGWAPYYAYSPTYIVRPKTWYAPRWQAWYVGHPIYWQNFHRKYPYWRGHRTGQRYNQQFYEKYHHGQGAGWHKGFQAGGPPQPGGRRPGPGHVGPPPRGKQGPEGKEHGRSHERGHGDHGEEGR
jgi:hypothetical protein